MMTRQAQRSRRERLRCRLDRAVEGWRCTATSDAEPRSARMRDRYPWPPPASRIRRPRTSGWRARWTARVTRKALRPCTGMRPRRVTPTGPGTRRAPWVTCCSGGETLPGPRLPGSASSSHATPSGPARRTGWVVAPSGAATGVYAHASLWAAVGIAAAQIALLLPGRAAASPRRQHPHRARVSHHEFLVMFNFVVMPIPWEETPEQDRGLPDPVAGHAARVRRSHAGDYMELRGIRRYRSRLRLAARGHRLASRYRPGAETGPGAGSCS